MKWIKPSLAEVEKALPEHNWWCCERVIKPRYDKSFRDAIREYNYYYLLIYCTQRNLSVCRGAGGNNFGMALIQNKYVISLATPKWCLLSDWRWYTEKELSYAALLNKILEA